jgi:enoyl-CoA hydratase/carnithine racemase
MIEFKVTERVGELIIRRPSTGNAFTGEMVDALCEIMNLASRDADIVTLTGEGADFTVGRDRTGPPPASPFAAFSAISALNKAIAAYPGILVARVRGRAFGLGVGLILRSDIAIAADDARFGLDEVAHGIPPMFVMEELVDHLPGKRVLDIVLSGREFGAEEALQMGLISRTVAAPMLDQAAGEFVALVRGRDRSVVLACKRYLRAVRAMPRDARGAFALVEQTQFALSKR